MIDINELIRPAFKFLSAESKNICRLCFGAIDDGNMISLEERRVIQCNYYDDIVSFGDILSDFGATTDPFLPRTLCEYCSDTAITSFLFKQLCQQSHNKWDEIIEKFQKTISLSEQLTLSRPTVKTAYLMLHNENNLMLTSRKNLKEKKKEIALLKIEDLIKRRNAYKKVRKKSSAVCEECGIKLLSRSRLARHMRIHSNEKFACKQCSKVFLSKVQLHDHFVRVHKPKTIQCSKCSQMFSSEKMKKCHESTHHTAIICKCCSVQFSSKKELRKHTKREVYKCPRCNKAIKHKHTFRRHLIICGNNVEKETNFICDICDKGYSNKSGLRSHLKTLHGFGTVLNCSWCDKPFDSISKLKNHEVKHTRERNFHCEQCGGRFVTQAALVYHTRLHTGEKPFPCDLCNESFISSSRRMAHKRRKHWGPSRECTFCQSKFVSGHELRKHVARHKNPQSRLFVPSVDQPDLKCLVQLTYD